MKELKEIQSELKAPKGQYNNFGKYHYRSCEDILEAVKPLLKEKNCVLLLSDSMKEVGGRVYVEATATIINEAEHDHKVTASAREAQTQKGMNDAQITGSASSYARKYALNGLFAIDDTKDEDINQEESKSKLPLISDDRFNKALEQIEDGKYTVEKLIETFDLTVEQKNKLDG